MEGWRGGGARRGWEFPRLRFAYSGIGRAGLMLTGQTFRVVIIPSLAVAVASFLFSYLPTSISSHFVSLQISHTLGRDRMG